MILRYAKNKDIDFLVQGLEKNRVIENRPKQDIKARKSDIKEFSDAINHKNIRIIESQKSP